MADSTAGHVWSGSLVISTTTDHQMLAFSIFIVFISNYFVWCRPHAALGLWVDHPCSRRTSFATMGVVPRFVGSGQARTQEGRFYRSIARVSLKDSKEVRTSLGRWAEQLFSPESRNPVCGPGSGLPCSVGCRCLPMGVHLTLEISRFVPEDFGNGLICWSLWVRYLIPWNPLCSPSLHIPSSIAHVSWCWCQYMSTSRLFT